MTNWTTFGDKARFEIAVRWADDSEPREHRPEHGGWSTGELRLTVSNYVLTQNDGAADPDREGVRWYLLPIFEWLAQNWVSLLHEERFAWRENSAAPAASAVFLALRRLIDDDISPTGDTYDDVHAWWSRHALRASDASALYPDVVFRRLRDEIEISWTARQPNYAPDGFRFVLMPGVAALPVSDVAGPLWEALNWLVPASANRLSTPEDRRSIERLEDCVRALRQSTFSSLEAGYLPPQILSKLSRIRSHVHLNDNSRRLENVPALERLDDAVLMFGGVSPDIGLQDMRTLLGLLASKAGGSENAKVQALVDDSVGAPSGVPFQEGYDLAERLLDTCSLPGTAPYVDVRALLAGWGVKVVERALKTTSIRGVAIAGAGYAPTILINKISDYNANEAGKRFTLAHELFHVLYDRTRARRVSHTSGPWASPGVEKRANAFAAMFLMPKSLLARSLQNGEINEATVTAAANDMQVGVSALVEHLYNASMIDESTRDKLRRVETGSPHHTTPRSKSARRSSATRRH